MISDDIVDALLDQLNHEFQSANLYLAMSAYCSHVDFNGAAAWLRTQYEEEQLHALKIYDYLIDQDVHVVLGAMPAPATEFGSLLDVFQASLDRERDHRQTQAGWLRRLRTAHDRQRAQSPHQRPTVAVAAQNRPSAVPAKFITDTAPVAQNCWPAKAPC